MFLCKAYKSVFKYPLLIFGDIFLVFEDPKRTALLSVKDAAAESQQPGLRTGP